MGNSEKMPVLFVGHGSPMNAIETNEFSSGWASVGKTLPVPAAILCISAHWETKGTYLTAMEVPRTIHDFGGFPDALYEVKYPAPGSPELARKTCDLFPGNQAGLDESWGLDHGAWSILKHLYPKADIPVVEMSLDYSKSPREHYMLATQLAKLRKMGVLIIGSGNIVHNLRLVDWRNAQNSYPWAAEADARIRELISRNDHAALISVSRAGKCFELSVPTPEHYLPLLYSLALKEENETVSFFNTKIIMGSVSMTSFVIS